MSNKTADGRSITTKIAFMYTKQKHITYFFSVIALDEKENEKFKLHFK